MANSSKPAQHTQHIQKARDVPIAANNRNTLSFPELTVMWTKPDFLLRGPRTLVTGYTSDTRFFDWNHICQPPKRHLDRFGHFCTVHPCVQHPDRQTQRRWPTCDICGKRTHSMAAYCLSSFFKETKTCSAYACEVLGAKSGGTTSIDGFIVSPVTGHSSLFHSVQSPYICCSACMYLCAFFSVFCLNAINYCAYIIITISP